MTKSKVDIIISVIMKFPPREFKNCYIGITSEKDKNLKESNILQKSEFIYERASSHIVAEELEEKFLKLGMHRAPHENFENSDVIFVYKPINKMPDKN